MMTIERKDVLEFVSLKVRDAAGDIARSLKEDESAYATYALDYLLEATHMLRVFLRDNGHGDYIQLADEAAAQRGEGEGEGEGEHSKNLPQQTVVMAPTYHHHLGGCTTFNC